MGEKIKTFMLMYDDDGMDEIIDFYYEESVAISVAKELTKEGGMYGGLEVEISYAYADEDEDDDPG